MTSEYTKNNLAIPCIDDEQVILTSLTGQPRSHFGKRVSYETALDGEESLAVLDDLCKKGIKTIVIVSDWLMSSIKGDEPLVQIHEHCPNTIKVMLTGQADCKSVEKAKLYSYIQKSWSRDELLPVLETGLKSLQEST